MAKEIYLYYPIFDFTAQEVISAINENMGKECQMRLCSPGGSVRAGWGIYAKMKEHGNITLKVDGAADSMASFAPLYAKRSECLNVTKFVFHRADMYVETDEDQKFLDSINNDLKAQMKAKINEQKWIAITGVSIDELFNPSTRKDYPITGEQAVEIGLCDKCNELTPEGQKEIEAINSRFYKVAAMSTETTKTIKMDLNKFKTEHPDVYAQAVAEGIAKEKSRVEVWAHYSDVDPKAVKEGISGGKEITALQIVEFTEKKFNVEALKKIEGENPQAVQTKAKEEEKAKAPEAKVKDENEKKFWDALDKHLKIAK